MELYRFTFVDDSYIITNVGYVNSLGLTMKKIETTIGSWEGLAKTTRGTIAHGNDKVDGTWFTLYMTIKKSGNIKTYMIYS